MSEAAAKPLHTVSVRELVEFVLRRGDLGGEREFVGSDRALAGIRGHQKIQRSRPTGYLIDLDMNHGATRHFGVIPEAYMGSYEMLVGDEEARNLVLTHEEEDVSLPAGLDLIPAARKLEGIDQALAHKSKFI